MGRVLVVDDDRNHLRVMKGLIGKEGVEVVTALDVESALSCIDHVEFDVIITDLRMPDKSGMDILAHCRERKPAVPVILLTGHGDVEMAVSAMKLGAYDFVTKPVDEHKLLNAVHEALAESGKNRKMTLAYFDTESGSLPDIIVKAAAIEEILQIAPKNAAVLICGETEAGRELVAETIDVADGRHDKPFVKVNWAAIILALRDRIRARSAPPSCWPNHGAAKDVPSGFKERLDDIVCTSEKQMIVDALNKTGQNRTRAAELLGISRRTLQNKIKEYGL